MKLTSTILALFISLLFSAIGLAQPAKKPTIQFLGIPNTVNIVDTELDDDGSLYVAGNYTETFTFQTQNITHEGLNDALIIKLDASGNYLWHFTKTNASHNIEITDILLTPNSLFTTGALDTLSGNLVFSVLKLSKTDGTVTETIGFDSALSGEGNSSRGLQLGIDGSKLNIGVFFSGVFDVEVGNNGINTDSLTANGGEDLIIFRVNTSFIDDDLPFVRFGNENAPENPASMRFTSGNNLTYVGYETTDTNYLFGDRIFSKNQAISRTVIIHGYNWSNLTRLNVEIKEESLPVNTIQELIYSPQSNRIVGLFNQENLTLLNTGDNTVRSSNFIQNSLLDGLQLLDLQFDTRRLNLVVLGSYTGPQTAVFNFGSTTTYPAGSSSVPNLYKFDMTINAAFGNSVSDVDNMGEFNGDIERTHFAYNPVASNEYSLISTINSGTNIKLPLNNFENTESSKRRYLLSKPDRYFEFTTPLDGDTLHQFGIDTLQFYGYDVIGDINRGNSSNPNVAIIGPVSPVGTVLGRSSSPFGSILFDNSSGSAANDVFFYMPDFPELDTLNVFIEQAGRITAPLTISFNNVLAERSVTQSILIGNTGTSQLQISSFTLQNDSLFSVSGSLDTIPIGGTDTLFVTFSPRYAGTANSSLVIQSDAGGNSTLTVPILGTAVSVSPSARFAIDSTATQQLNPFNPFTGLPSTQIGEPDTVSTFIINAGADTLNINSFSFANGGSFRLPTNGDSTSVLLQIPEKPLLERIRKLDIIFEPNEFRDFTDTLFVQTNDSSYFNGRIPIPLFASGTDTLGRLEANQDPIVFNSVLSENDTANVVINLSNTGLKDLIIGSVTFSEDYFALGESVNGNTLNPLVTTEVPKDGNLNVAIQATPDLYDLLGDTTLKEAMTINHNGSGGKSTFDIEINVIKTSPTIEFKQFFGNNIVNNFPSSEVTKSFGLLPIQTFYTEQIEFYNVGTDTLTVGGLALVKSIEQSIVHDERIETTLSLSKDVLAPGDTSVVTLDFELFEFSPFEFSLQIFSDAEEVSYLPTQFSNITTIETQTGDFSYLYSGTGSVPNKTVQMTELLTDTLHPSFVNILLQATDQQGVGMTFLDQDNPNDLNPDGTGFFSVTENGNTVDPNAAEQDFRIFKQDAIDFEINTALVLDMSTSIPLQDLPNIKEGAKNLVRNLEEDQKIAIYIFSDIVEQKISFTSDTTALINVIDELQRTGSSTNLFGAVIDAANDLNPLILSTRDKIARGNIVVFTDGAHNANNLTSSNVNAVTTDLDVYAVGVGAANISELQAITGFSGRVFSAADFDELNSEFRKVQREIAKTADSFYVLSYISPSRNTANVPLVVTIDSPLSGQSLTTNFSSVGFSSLFSQVVVNQNFPELLGIDTLYIPANLETDAFATTILNADTPTYKWESSDQTIVSISDENDTDGIGILVPEGIEGQFTQVTVTDTSNFNLAGTEFLSKTFTVILGAKVEVPVFNLTILTDQTGTFELGNTGISLTISSNTGDGFSLSASTSSNPGSNLPEGVELIFQDIYWIINLESTGTPEFEYSISLDVSDFDLTIPERATILKRDNGSSDWVDLIDAGLTVNLENDIITVSGLSSFSEFAIAQKSETVSTEGFSDIPSTFSLEQNYPNPFNPSTVINFGLPNASDVSISLFNVIGQKVMNITSNRYQAGWHNVSVDASGLASGIYIYRIQAGSFVQTKRMTLIK